MQIEIRSLVTLVQVFDMQTSVRFYRDVLGFEVVNTSREEDYGWALMRRDGVELMLNTAYDEGERPPVPDPVRVAAHADTGLFFGCPDVDAAYVWLRERGVAVREPVVSHYRMKQLWLKDPDGYEICFQWPI